MAGFNQYYVDPSLGSDTGNGSQGAPWGRLAGEVVQYALDVGITRDPINGDQINVVSGTDDTLGAALDITGTYGDPTEVAPLVFRGCTSTANDGGIGGIDGDGSYAIIGTKVRFVSVVDMHCHNTGNNVILYLDRGSAINCETNNSGDRGIQLYQYSRAINCHIHDIDSYGIHLESAANQAHYNYIKNDGVETMAYGIYSGSYDNHVSQNIISVDSSTHGIYLAPDFQSTHNNTIFSNGGYGNGLQIGSGWHHHNCLNNLIAGFSSGSGKGIFFYDTPGEPLDTFGHNAVYDCATKYSNLADADFVCNFGNNEELTSSPFMKTGADTFVNRFAYFEPSDAGNIRGGAYPAGCRLDKGAVQHIHRKRRLQMRVIA